MDFMDRQLQTEKIVLTEAQQRMLQNAWGKETIENSRVEKFFYESDGLNIKSFIAYPENIRQPENGFPVILWNRGGFAQDGEIDDFTARGLFGEIASWGYIVLASQYRGSRYSEGMDEFGGADVNDIMRLTEIAEYIPQADTDIMGIEGWSRGGMMTYLVLCRTDRFKAAVISGGITDLRCSDRQNPLTGNFFTAYMQENPAANTEEECRKRSVIYFPERLASSTPILLMHGTADNRVPAMDSLSLSSRLLELNRPFRLVLFENGDHFLKSHRTESRQLRREWFGKYLKKNI